MAIRYLDIKKKEENMLAKAAKKRRKEKKPRQPAMVAVSRAAPLLGVRVSTVRRWSHLGILEYLRVGSFRHRRYIREDLESFKEQQDIEKN